MLERKHQEKNVHDYHRLHPSDQGLGISHDWVPLAPASEPTNTRPGSWERISVYVERLAAGEDLWHPNDSRDAIAKTHGNRSSRQIILEGREEEVGVEAWTTVGMRRNSYFFDR